MKTQERIRAIQHFLFIGVFLFLSFTINAANAPITSLGTVCDASNGQQITIPIKVTGFINIGSSYLTLDYEYAKLHWVSGTKNPALVGYFDIGEFDMGNGKRRITISWTGSRRVDLTDQSTLVNLNFNYISGSSSLLWVTDDVNSANDFCEYADPRATVLNDNPSSTYYINGLVSASCSNIPTITANGQTSFCEGGSVELTASAGSAYKWSPGGATTQKITVTTSGNYTVEVTDAGGAKATSEATAVTVTQAPDKPTLSVTPPTCANANGLVAVTSATTGLTFSIDGTNYASYAAPFTVAGGANYSITAKNVGGCVSIAATGTMGAALTAPDKPTLSVTPPTCANANGLAAVTSVTTGLTFSTDGTNYASYTAPFTVAGGANYSITAKNVGGCVSMAASGTMGAALTAPDKPTLSVTPPTCANANGLVAVTTVTTGLTFSTDGANYAAYSAPFTVAGGANYSITAKNVSGCVSLAATGTMGAVLTAPDKPTLSVTPPTCANSNGLVAVTSITTGLTFSTDGINYSTYTAPFVVAGGANYSITAKNASGCVSMAATGTMGAALTAPDKPTLSVTPPTCANANGLVAVTSVTTGLTFSTDGTNFATYTAPFVVAGGANYSITAKNVGGCVSLAASGTMGAALTAPDKPTLSVTPPTCANANGLVAITSATTGLTFSTDGTNYASYTAPFIVAGGANYSITAKNVGGCVSLAATGTMGAVLTAPDKPTLSVTPPTCANSNGSVAVTSVTTGLTFSTDGTNYATYTAPFVVAGGANYSITAKNIGGCVSLAASGTMGAALTAPDKPTLSVTPPTCANANGLVAVTSVITGLTFSTDGTNYASYSAPFTVAGGANYSITAKNIGGCVSLAATGTMGAALTAPDKPTLGVTPPTCANANGLVAVTSVTTGLTFSTDGTNYATYSAPFTVAGGANYSITAKNIGGCVSMAATGTMGAALTAPTVVSASVTPASIIGSGQVVFSATPSFGTIKWFDEAINGTEVAVLNPTITTTTTYYAEAISTDGCVSASRTAVTASVIPQGTTQLSYRFANPRIRKISGTDRFEFDVQLKADVTGTEFLKGNVNLDFNNSTLSSNSEGWIATPVSGSVTDLLVSGSNLNIELDIPNSLAISTTYQTLITISGKITNVSGEAGIDFNEGNMNGKQFSKLAASPGLELYKSPNSYEKADFVDTWVGRVYAIKYGWSQIGGMVVWADEVNSSVWEGDALVPFAKAKNLRIHKPATLTILVDAELTVSGNTDIQPALGLIIESDATGTGSLITGTSSGTASVQRYMTTTAWHIVSSPVSGQSIPSFLGSNPNVATDDDNFRGMMDYNPALNDWNNYFNSSTTGDLETAKGFSMRTNANSAVTFTGTLQSGNQTATGLTPALWNCVGNPYTSAIGINESSVSTANFLTANADQLDPSFGAIYVWHNGDENNGIWGKYTIISNAPDFGDDAAFDVQQGQAYMVKMNTAATTVSYSGDMQIHNPELELKSSKGIWSIVKLNASISNQKSSTTIAFNNGMTKGLDRTYDAGLLRSGSDLVIYSKLVEDNGIPFAIQTLPSNDFSNLIIPLGIESKTGGELIFTSETMNLPATCQLILEDKVNKTFTDLSVSEYTTEIAANSNITDRFRIHTSALTTGMVKKSLVGNLNAYAVRNTEIRISGRVSNQAIATLYDLQGRIIQVKTLEEGSINIMHTPNIKSAIYMLSVNDNGQVQRFKIPVNE